MNGQDDRKWKQAVEVTLLPKERAPQEFKLLRPIGVLESTSN